MLHKRYNSQFMGPRLIWWQKPLKTRSQSEGLLRAAAFEKSCPVEPTLQDFPGEGVGLGKGQDGGWVQKGEQVFHQLGSHPEHNLCLSVGHGSQNFSLSEALNFKPRHFTQRQTNAEHCVVIHSEEKRILYILAGIIDLLVLYRTKVATVFVEYTGQK